jgi:hypothetical protein
MRTYVRSPAYKRAAPDKADAMLPDDEWPEEIHRPVFTPIEGVQVAVLDGLLGAHSLRDVLGTLAKLCESRAPSEFDMDSDFSDHDADEKWQENANALYSILERVK